MGIWEWLFGEPKDPRGPLVRDFRFSASALEFMTRCSPEERMAVAELLLQLDGDPVGYSRPVLGQPRQPGLRWSHLPGHVVLLTIDAAHDRISILSIAVRK